MTIKSKTLSSFEKFATPLFDKAVKKTIKDIKQHIKKLKQQEQYKKKLDNCLKDSEDT